VCSVCSVRSVRSVRSVVKKRPIAAALTFNLNHKGLNARKGNKFRCVLLNHREQRDSQRKNK